MTKARQRICLITPGHLSTNPRIVKEADALQAAGYDITVISSRFLARGDRDDRLFDSRPWRSLRTVAFGPHAPRGVYLGQTVRRKAARLMATAGISAAAVVETAAHPAATALARAAAAVPADLYIAHYTAALPAAARAARCHGARYGFDAEDFHPGDLAEAPENRFEKRLINAIEQRYLPGAAHLTAASPAIAEAYANQYGIRPPVVVLNVFAPAPWPPDTVAECDIRHPALYWFSQTIGPGRGLECAIAAAARAAARPHLYVRGDVSPGYRATLESLAAVAGVADHLHFLPLCPPPSLEARGTAFDLGYAGETGFSPNNRFALANKLFSYLSSGLAVLLSDVPAHQRIAPELADAARLFTAGDADSLASAIDHFLGNPHTLDAARAYARMLANERYNWAHESGKLVAAVQASLRGAQ